VRRRARFLRKARELAYRDLGGLVFNLHRFGQRNDALVLAKLSTLSRIDAELRSLETALGERQPLTVLREAGVAACPRCAAIHSGDDRFCPNCGLPMSRQVDLPIAGAAASPAAAPTAGSAGGAPAADGDPGAAAGRSPIGPPASAHAVPSAAAVPSTPAAPSAPARASTPSPASKPARTPAPSRASKPARAPAPARASAPAPAPATAPADRSSSGPPASPAQEPPESLGEEEPTEILRPPPAGA
jgi:hypothetical protein